MKKNKFIFLFAINFFFNILIMYNRITMRMW